MILYFLELLKILLQGIHFLQVNTQYPHGLTKVNHMIKRFLGRLKPCCMMYQKKFGVLHTK